MNRMRRGQETRAERMRRGQETRAERMRRGQETRAERKGDPRRAWGLTSIWQWIILLILSLIKGAFKSSFDDLEKSPGESKSIRQQASQPNRRRQASDPALII